MAKNYERTLNVLTCKNHENKTTSVNFDDVSYWIEDRNDTVEVHLKFSNFALWLNVSEKEFKKNYISYRKELNKK